MYEEGLGKSNLSYIKIKSALKLTRAKRHMNIVFALLVVLKNTDLCLESFHHWYFIKIKRKTRL
jgi:hypothetical protein